MLEVLLSHWNFHLVTIFPSPEVLQKKKTTAPKPHPLEIPINLLWPSGSNPPCQSKTLPCAHPISYGPPICPPSACADALQTACRNAAYAFWQCIKFGRGLWCKWAGLGMWESACTSQASRHTAAADWKADPEDGPRRTLNLYLWWNSYTCA